MTFEFLEAGTATPVAVEIDHLLIGGQRKFAGMTWGTALFSLTNGGAAVASEFADPDAQSIDNDGSASIAGLGSAPIIQLDAPQFGPTLSSSAWLDGSNGYATVGIENVRSWTVLDWGSPSADTLVWELFGSAGTLDPQPDPETVDPASPTFPHTGLSSYISGLCITIPDGAVYDLALAKVQSAAYDPATQNAEFEVTVHNQGTVGSGAFTVTDELPAGTSLVSAGSGSASGNTVTWTVDAADELAPGESETFTLVLRVDDPALSPFENRAEISSSAGVDCDSTADTNLASGDALVDITDPADLVGGGCESGGADEDDHDVASFVVAPASTTTTTTTTVDASDPNPPGAEGDDSGQQGALPVTGTSSLWIVMTGVALAAVGMIVVDSGAHLAWRQRLARLSSSEHVERQD